MGGSRFSQDSPSSLNARVSLTGDGGAEEGTAEGGWAETSVPQRYPKEAKQRLPGSVK